jgi:hypothetical protein
VPGPISEGLGITFCPGKYDRHAMTGEWDRDLALDLDRVRDWGAVAVVTLLQPMELALLKLERLGEEILRRNMLWFHLLPGRQLVTLEDAVKYIQKLPKGGAAARGVADCGRSDAPGCQIQRPDHDGAHRRIEPACRARFQSRS